MDILQVGSELERVSKLISKKSDELSVLREDYQKSKALYENNFSRYYLETKAKQSEWSEKAITAQATNLAYNDKLDEIRQESSYRKVVGELKALYTEHEGLKEISFNLRAQIKKFN
jgi:hypothetical protein